MNPKLAYLLKSLAARFRSSSSACPSCGSDAYFVYPGLPFRKFPTTLRLCTDCLLLYRWPTTPAEESLSFYEVGYQEPGLTTELPDEEALREMRRTHFDVPEKYLDIWKPLFEALAEKLGRPLRIIDYGASWGYTAFEFARWDCVADCAAYEVAPTRRAFGARSLKLRYLDASDFAPEFDLLFSSHVIEHMHDPSLFRTHAERLLGPRGQVVLTCPNGGLDAIAFNPGWRRNWGQAHPNFVSDAYLLGQFGDYNGLITETDFSRPQIDRLVRSLDHPLSSTCPTGGNLLAVMRRSH